LAADSSKKVILYCHTFYANDKGGGEYSVYKTDVALLRAEGHQVIEYNKDDNEFFRAGLFKRLRMGVYSFFNPEVLREITSIVRSSCVDVALVQNTYLSMSPSIYVALRRHRIPIVQMVYNYRFICPNAQLYVKGKICERCVRGNYFNAVIHRCRADRFYLSLWFALIVWIKRRILKVDRWIVRFITPDEFLKGKLVAGEIAKDTIEVLRNPFDHAEYGISNKDEGYFLFVGRLIRPKGVYTFLEAAKNLRDATFVVIGDGEERENVERFIEQNGLENVQFLGSRFNEEMIEYLRNAKALVVPSEWYDNYPLVISYAYALGKPVIASRIDGIPEIVVDKETGLLFNPGDALDLSEKITLIRLNPSEAREMGVHGNRFLRNNLSKSSRYGKFNHLIGMMNHGGQI
jgi:glycosyltransferase involved in cell wall biosynthesis